MNYLNKGAFWLAAAAVVKAKGRLPPEIKNRWHEAISENSDPAVVAAIFQGAFPNIAELPMDQLTEVAGKLLRKSMDLTIVNPTAFLSPLRGPLISCPGLLIFAVEFIRLELTAQQTASACCRATEILLWMFEEATERGCRSLAAASTNLAASLALCLSQAAGQPRKLVALKLCGLCCEASLEALKQCWSPLENILFHEPSGEILHLAACALFAGLAAHQTAIDPTITAAAFENALPCSVACIQFPVIVASAAVMQQSPESALSQRVAAAAEHAQRIQQARVGSGGDWGWHNGRPLEAGAPLAVPGRQFNPVHCLEALKML